jgi:hypothetical protein
MGRWVANTAWMVGMAMATTMRAGPTVQPISSPRCPRICFGWGSPGRARYFTRTQARRTQTTARMSIVHQKMLTYSEWMISAKSLWGMMVDWGTPPRTR